MVDLRIPERDMTDRAIRRLSVTARHDYFSLMLLAVAMRSDGVIEVDDLDVIPWPVERASMTELERAGLLAKSGPKVWTLTRFAATQTAAQTLDALAAVREYERTKKARQRAHKAGMSDEEIAAVMPAERPGTRPGQVLGNAQDRPETGQRQSQSQAITVKAPLTVGAVSARTADAVRAIRADQLTAQIAEDAARLDSAGFEPVTSWPVAAIPSDALADDLEPF